MSEIRKFDWGAVSSAPKHSKPKSEKKAESKTQFYPRFRARLNAIPSNEDLARRINEALDALSRGVYWDRGSIVNIVL